MNLLKRRLADYGLAGLGLVLKVLRQDRTFAEKLVRLQLQALGFIADQDHVGGDADMRAVVDTVLGGESLETGMDVLRRTQRPFGIVLVRARMAEPDQQAVAESTRRVTVIPFDRFPNDTAEVQDNVASFFFGKSPCDPRRSDKIDEHDRYWPVLSQL